ncbi:helix-turn-helix domain-containing protein [Streptomyces sp. 900105755]
MHSVSKPKKVGSWLAVGAVLAHCRKQARVTQEQFAEMASIHVDTVGSIEQGRLALQPDRAEQFDELLGTGGNSRPPPSTACPRPPGGMPPGCVTPPGVRIRRRRSQPKDLDLKRG